MAYLMHLSRRHQDILDSGVLYGSTRYNQLGKGLTDSYPLIHALAVRNQEEPCCPEFGEPVFLFPSALERASSEWKLCYPDKGGRRMHRGCEVLTLYLIPSNHAELVHLHLPWEQDNACKYMGMSYVMLTLPAGAVHEALEAQLDNMEDGDHLHVIILAESIPLRPPAGQPGSCRCGNIASPACDHKLCSSCCSGCSRHCVQQQEQYESLEESSGYVAPVPVQHLPVQPQQQFCSCGKPAAGACVGLHCKECCGNYRDCRRHFPDGPPVGIQTSAAAPQRPLIHMGGITVHSPVAVAAAQPSPSSAQQPMIRVGGGGIQVQPLGAVAAQAPSSSTRSSSTTDTAARRTDQGQSSSSSNAMQAIRERMLLGLTEYLSSGAVQQQRSCDVEPLMNLMHLALDSDVWQQAEADGCHSSTTAGNRPSSSSKAATAPGSLSAEEQLHQVMHCVVCMDAPRTVVLLPCKHLVLCHDCSKQLQQIAARDDSPGSSSRVRGLCPVCRVPAAQHMPGVILS